MVRGRGEEEGAQGAGMKAVGGVPTWDGKRLPPWKGLGAKALSGLVGSRWSIYHPPASAFPRTVNYQAVQRSL